MEETEKITTLMAYAVAHRPAVVILESVGDLLTSQRVRACGAEIEARLRSALPNYEWRAQVVDPERHCKWPMRRERGFWVGTRPTAYQ